MKVAYKWKITTNKSAYITSEETLGGKPFIYDSANNEVMTLSEVTTGFTITEYSVNDSTISLLASSMAKSDYEVNLEELKELLKLDENGQYYALGNVEDYYAEDLNDCLKSETGITISTNVATKTLECESGKTAEAYVEVHSAGTKDNQTISFEFGIPAGCPGPIGPDFNVTPVYSGKFNIVGVQQTSNHNEKSSLDLQWVEMLPLTFDEKVVNIPQLCIVGKNVSEDEGTTNARQIYNGTGHFLRLIGHDYSKNPTTSAIFNLIPSGTTLTAENINLSAVSGTNTSNFNISATQISANTSTFRVNTTHRATLSATNLVNIQSDNNVSIVGENHIGISTTNTNSGTGIDISSHTINLNGGIDTSTRETLPINFNLTGNSQFNGDLNVSGTTTVTNSITAKAFYTNSDERLKNIIGDLHIEIDKLLELSLIYYTLKDDENAKLEIGVIAQEMQKICPQIVKEDENGYLSVDYSKLSILALYCIKDLYTKIGK